MRARRGSTATAASAAPFQILDDAFKSAHGFEADIDVRQVTAAQCPALSFVGRLRQQRDRAPQLQIGETSLRSGQALTGTVQVVGNRQRAIAARVGGGRGAGPVGSVEARGRQLHLQSAHAAHRRVRGAAAIAARREQRTAAAKRSRDAQSPADQLFPLAGVEVARTGQSIGATIRYFKLDL